MKKFLCVCLFGAIFFAVSPAFAEPATAAVPAAETLTKFDLDFPGGSPQELILAIEKAMGRPLNAIIASEYDNVKMPPIRMTGIDVQQLFEALEQATESIQPIFIGSNANYQKVEFGFRTQVWDPRAPGVVMGKPLSDSSIWSFFYNGPQKTKFTRFYLLTPYLNRGLTVDDITTAIQTGWKMLGDSPKSALSFHKETNLLIAIGESNQLQTIDSVLQALNTPVPPVKTKPNP